MDAPRALKVKDVLSYLGRDYLVEGVLSYKIDGKTRQLARVVDGAAVLWVEPVTDDLHDRLLLFSEVTDLAIGTPPPESISYRGGTFVPRLTGRATVDVSGDVGARRAGTVEVWRYRAASDLFLQIELGPSGRTVLFGESVHQGMIDVLSPSG